MTHPITQTLRRGRDYHHAGCHLGLHAHADSDASWVPIATLAADGARLHATLQRIGREVGSERRDVQASLFLEAYTWRLVLPLAGAIVAEQRVAAPTADDVSLRPALGRPHELRLRPSRFSVLPTDSAAAHRDATVARTPAALADRFENALTEHFQLIVDALNAISRRSQRALWIGPPQRCSTPASPAMTAKPANTSPTRSCEEPRRFRSRPHTPPSSSETSRPAFTSAADAACGGARGQRPPARPVP